MTIDDIDRFRYAGDCIPGSHRYEYMKAVYGDPAKLIHQEYCYCGVKIQSNHLITDGQYIMVLGSCCIKKFVKNGVKINCSLCHEVHRNRNRAYICNTCKLTRCSICTGDKLVIEGICTPCRLQVLRNPVKQLELIQLISTDEWKWDELSHTINIKRIDLPNITFKLKDYAKMCGAQWDMQNRIWYIYSNSPYVHRLQTMGISWIPF